MLNISLSNSLKLKNILKWKIKLAAAIKKPEA